MQPLLGRDRQAALFGHRDEIAKMPELHRGLPYPQGMPLSLQSLFLRRQDAYIQPREQQACNQSAASEAPPEFPIDHALPARAEQIARIGI